MYLWCKRFVDFLISLVALVLLSPVFLLIALIMQVESPGPVLFTQKRVGKGKSHFLIYKFRTMTLDTPRDVPTHLLANPAQYITKIGGFLRKTSLDELPQLINILLGRMSCIGPRPALWNQFDLVAERDKYVGRYGLTPNDLLPGLTGWAQINGRDELSIDEKARFDGIYVQQLGLAMDLRCFWGTLISVFRQKGVVEGAAGGKAEKKVEEKAAEGALDEAALGVIDAAAKPPKSSADS